MEILREKIKHPANKKLDLQGSLKGFHPLLLHLASSKPFLGCSLPWMCHLQLEDGCSRLVTQFKGLSSLIQFAALKISWKGEVKALHSLEQKNTGGSSDQVES